MITVMCGPPGSGKTTWIARNRQPGAVICSTEQLRTTPGLDRGVRLAFLGGLSGKADQALAAGRDVIVDGCHTRAADRAKWLDLAGRHGVRTRLVVLDTPLAAALFAQQHRDHPVSGQVVRRYYHQFRRTLGVIADEGWDEVVWVDRAAAGA